MKKALPALPSRGDAPALRFLLLCLAGWALLRMVDGWTPVSPSLHDPSAPREPAPARTLPAMDRLSSTLAPLIILPGRAGPRTAALITKANAARPFGPVASRPVAGGDAVPLTARVLPPPELSGSAPGSLAEPLGGRPFAPVLSPGMQPGGTGPYWTRRQMAGWSLAGWGYLRNRPRVGPAGIAAASQLGASQAGARVAFGFGRTGRLRAFGRATAALDRPQQSEGALGLAFAPVARWPIDVAVEQRFAVGREGRTALAVMVVGGVGDVALPAQFRLEAYGQTGVVGTRRRDGFADGLVVIDRALKIGSDDNVRVGALVAGSVQPGAARVDVGPRVTLRLPDIGKGSRIALDWRQRVAGDAQPESGLALTLASDF